MGGSILSRLGGKGAGFGQSGGLGYHCRDLIEERHDPVIPARAPVRFAVVQEGMRYEKSWVGVDRSHAWCCWSAGPMAIKAIAEASGNQSIEVG